MNSTTGSDSLVLWRFLSGRQEAYCLLSPHPIGHEIRYFFNGVQLIGVVAGSLDELEQRADQWKQRLIVEGWAEVAPRLTTSQGRARTASG